MGSNVTAIKEYATIAFTLLGVLFGMMIMTFIFGQLGNANATTFTDATITKINLTNAWINTSNFTIPEASFSNFTGNVAIIQAINLTNGYVIGSGNYSVIPSTGVVYNTSTEWPYLVNISYSLTEQTDAEANSISIQNNSLNGIVTYTGSTSTQFSTVSIAITLVILIGVFLLFWKIFVSDKKGNNNNWSNN